MTNDRFRPRLEPDNDLTRGLRSLYASPTEESYWRGLEAKILGRIANEGSSDVSQWWVFFGDWVKAGVVAAGIVAIMAGVALYEARTTDHTAAFEAAWEVAPDVPVQTAAQTPAAREATLRYVISY
jgi:hypothetical protein